MGFNFRSWLRRLHHTLGHKSDRKPPSTYRKRKPFVPEFERLETRWLMTTVQFASATFNIGGPICASVCTVLKPAA